MSDFSFFRSVFKRLLLQTRKIQRLFGKGLTIWQMTNFSLLKIERVCRQQIWIEWKWQKILQTVRKHLGEKEKLLVMSDFSTFTSVFKRLLLQTHKKDEKIWLPAFSLSPTMFSTLPKTKIFSLVKAKILFG